MIVARAFQNPVSCWLAATVQAAPCTPSALFKVIVIVPLLPGDPVPAVKLINPPESLDPAAAAQEGVVPPPVVNTQVGDVGELLW